MAFDGFVTKKVCYELQSCLIGGKINKIFEPNKNEIILGIYSNGKNYALNIDISSNNYRMNLTTSSKPNPTVAPNFCMVLRKHLIGFKIKEIITNGLERLIIINFEGFNELNDIVQKKLIIELMGKHSNIILSNERNIIIDSLRHLDTFSNSYRDILPAHEYVFPTSDKKDFYTTSVEDFLILLDNKKEPLSKLLPDIFNGFSKTFVKYALFYLTINESNYNNEDLKTLYNYIKNILENLCNSATSCTLTNNDYIITSTPSYDLLQTNFFLDDFYTQKENNEVLTNYRNNLLKLVLSALKKISKKLSNINQKLDECSNMEKYRIYGELITANLYQIDNNLRSNSIALLNYYDNNNEIIIPLDNTISPSYNAKKYFKKYNKLKNTLEIVSKQKTESEKEIDYLESIIYELENITNIEDIDEIYSEICENVLFKDNLQKNDSVVKKNKTNKRKIHDEYEPITYNVDGFTLFVGKNNKQNDYITTKLGKNDDLWFHTKDIRGSHSLLKCNGSKVSSQTIIACAQITAYHSKARLSSNVPVDYCPVKNVKKPSGSKPGMVIYNNYNTINVNPAP